MKSAYPAERFGVARRSGARILALVIVAGTLGACQTSRDKAEMAPPNDYRERHPITIHEKTRAVVVFVGNSRGGLTPAQRADVAAFAHAWKREATGGIVIDLPVRTPNARAAADTVPEIRSILAAAGVPEGGMRVHSYQPVDPRDLASIRLNYPRMTADAGPCGQWPDDLGPSLKPAYVENRPYHNLGCATQRNLAAMVENPADLVQPRGETPAYTGRRTTVLEKYRKGESTASIDTNASKAKISDVGK